MADVTLKHIRKVYSLDAKTKKEIENTGLQLVEDGVLAVDDVNLEIKDKEFIVLVGPSGCGKSTTLNMVAGLETITDGELYIDGKLVNDVEPQDRDIAMVFQSYALYPHMSVYDNMSFSLRLKKFPKDEIDKRVKEAAEILGITEYLNRKPRELSGGQRQRVAIGRAIVRNPKVFLMDEPLSNLDAKLRNQMRAEIISLRQRINTTFIYVTHDQTEAMTLGDRIVVMKDGVVQQVGTPQDVFNKPKNLFVAGFIGAPQMNFFDAKLNCLEGEYSVSIGDFELVLDLEKQNNLKKSNIKSQDIILGIRPEHIIVDKELRNDGLLGEITVSEMLGSTVHVHFNTVDTTAVAIVPTIDLNGRELFKMGSKISYRFPQELIHIFDKETKLNLEYLND